MKDRPKFQLSDEDRRQIAQAMSAAQALPHEKTKDVPLVGGPRDGGVIKVHPLTNCAVYWEIAGHWYRYNAGDGKAYHVGPIPLDQRKS